MPDFLTTSLSGSQTNPPALIVWHIGTALIFGLAVAGLYRLARRGETVQATFVTTLVLLAAVIAMATQVIGDNVARAFSMVGALSVVRFRTVVIVRGPPATGAVSLPRRSTPPPASRWPAAFSSAVWPDNHPV